MDVNSLCEAYRDKYWKAEQKTYRLLGRIEDLRRKAEELREKADKKETDADELEGKIKRIPKVDWVKWVVEPLAEELRKMTGKKLWTILGPDSTSAQNTYIILHDEEADKAFEEGREQPCLEIVLRPGFKQDCSLAILNLMYETGEYTDEYYIGERGQLKYRNAVTAPLPDSIEDVAKLLKPVEMMIP